MTSDERQELKVYWAPKEAELRQDVAETPTTIYGGDACAALSLDWAGHEPSIICPCEPTVDPPYRIHRPFSDPDIQSPAYTETADEPEEAGP